jgi:NodT family efflux transporter outer membrane factor (OMF) lipoprotein
MKKLSLALLVTLTLSGCGGWLKSDYQRPMISVPPAWRVQSTGTEWLKNTPHWWDNFHDPLLSSALNRVLVSNNDLAKAGLQLQRARLEAGLTDTNLTPGVTLGGNASNSRNLKKNTTPVESYSASLGLSYELDLWGKLSSQREQSAWLVNASQQDQQNTVLSLLGTTADLYWQIANFNQQIANQQAGIAVSQQTLRLVQAKYAAGAIGRMDLLQAQQSLFDRQNQERNLQQQREAARNAFALLFNRSPLDRQPERAALDPEQNVAVAQSLPVEVIARRPDVQAAEWRLRAALAGSDAARLSFYPTLSLSSTVSAGSSAFEQWFANPVGALGSAVALPFVQWNTVQLTVARAGIDVQQAAIDFRSAVYTALSDVDNAQTQRLSYQQQRESQLQGLALSQQRLALAESQYRAGAVSFQTLLDAQDSLLGSETNLSNLQYNYLNATMKLWLAMGGGVTNQEQKTGPHDE